MVVRSAAYVPKGIKHDENRTKIRVLAPKQDEDNC